MEKIFAALSTQSSQEQFCDGLTKYLLYANDRNDPIARLFMGC